MSSYRGGGRGGRGRSQGRGRGGRGGRANQTFGMGHGQHGHGHGPSNHEKPHVMLCRHFLSPNTNCQNSNCSFGHDIRMHTEITNSDVDDNQRGNGGGGYNRGYNSGPTLHETSDVALWNDPSNTLKVFTSSYDGHWRMYNAANGFSQEFKHNMSGKINQVLVASNFLFCAFEGNSVKVPNVGTGMIHAWNLGNPGDPPIEFNMHETAPYAHARGVTSFITKDDMCVSGGRDSVIRIWKFDPTLNAPKGGFKLVKECCGHAGDITGLAMVNTMMWSCSTDGTIRLWDSSANWECKYLIAEHTIGNATNPTPQVPPAPQSSGGPPKKGVGHSKAVTSLVSFREFILSSSLDGTVKVWNTANGECTLTTDCGSGVVSMALSQDTKGHDIIILGTEDGTIMIRNVFPIGNIPAMHFLCSIEDRRMHCGHIGAVKSVTAGPNNTFYTAGADGKLKIWEIVGDFNL